MLQLRQYCNVIEEISSPFDEAKNGEIEKKGFHSALQYIGPYREGR